MTIPPNQPGPNDAQMIYIPVGVFTVICPTLVGLRVWSRLRKGGKLGPDDYLIMASLIFALASSAVEIASCLYGFGQHIYLLTTTNKENALMYFYICQATYKTSINLTKCSILLLYIRIFGNVRWFKWICYVLATIVAMYCIASVLATIFQCQPIAKAWNKTLPGTCINSAEFWYANAGFSVATDLIILFIPMPLVYNLQIPRVQKIALVIVFALGGFVVITSCLRMTTINLAATTPDTTYEIASTMWTVIEMNVAIVCACLPMIRPLIVKVFPRLMPRSTGNTRNKYGISGPSAYGAHSSKGYMSSHSRSENERDEWSRVEGKDGITMTSIRKGDQSSEEYILHEDRSVPVASPSSVDPPVGRPMGRIDHKNGMGIQKTVQYSVEYTKEKQQHDWA